MTVIAAVAVSIPLLVAAVVCIIAYGERSRLPASAFARLAIATTAAIVVVRFFPDPKLTIGLTIILFVLFVTPVTRSIERSALHRSIHAVRNADLVPRTVGMYLPLTARATLAVAGLSLLVWVASRVSAERTPLMTAGFTFAALTFFGLYETWIRQEVFAVRATDDAERRRRVRTVFVAQFVLTVSFLVLAALAAGSWPGFVPLGVTASVLGSIGCGLALSTGVQQRFLEASRSDSGAA